jgi:two-component system CAI-1 autoinducer sensor kinase/phosphatase CqsS
MIAHPQNWIDSFLEPVDDQNFVPQPKLLLIVILAMIGFPLYFWVWHNLFPQPYENLTLRIIGSLVWFPLLFAKKWGNVLGRYLRFYWLFALLYSFPFFFTFMLLKNSGSQVWLMSSLSALFLLIVLVNWLQLTFLLSIGIFAAFTAIYISGDNVDIPNVLLEQIPIFLFTAIAGIVMNFTNEKINQGRLSAMHTAAINIAHELRTPLLGIKSAASGLEKYLPSLVEGYKLAEKNDLVDSPIRKVHLDNMEQILKRLDHEVNHSNTIIDIFLVNSRPNAQSFGTYKNLSMAECIRTALDRYPFASEQERQQIMFEPTSDFRFLGSEILMVHVYFNLIKNALYSLAAARHGLIHITLTNNERGGEVHFRDSGTGIPENILPHVFERFYSWNKDNTKFGTGVGLAFCKSVINNYGAEITCASKYGEFTEFVMAFPKEKTFQ